MSKENGLDSLSRRAQDNVKGVDYWETLVAAFSNPWSKSNPNGMYVLVKMGNRRYSR